MEFVTRDGAAARTGNRWRRDSDTLRATAESLGAIPGRITRRKQCPKGRRSFRVGLAWLEASIQARQGWLAEAEQACAKYRPSISRNGFRLEVVLSTIDLVELLVLQDRTAEGFYLVEEILPSLRAWRLHKATLAVVALLGEHLQERTAEVETFRALADRLRRTWHPNGASGLPAA